ncbi:hypothetical protein L53_03670 [Hyphomonas sp. L-53-1-40]|nr:hypothetical protein L53_03670 [Hyphomonas sp. L-53-1-40]
MSDEELKRRQEVTFLQAEGISPLPELTSGTDVTSRFRSFAYDVLIDAFGYSKRQSTSSRRPTNNTKFVWKAYFSRFSDDIPIAPHQFNSFIKEYISSGDKLLDLLQFCARYEILSSDQFSIITNMLRGELIGYQFVGKYGERTVTLMPISDEAEADANQADYSALESHPSAQEHFRQAVEEIKLGHFRGSVTESINGVESVIKALSGKATVTLGDGLKHLDKQSPLNKTLKAGLEKIYGWTNSPNGMRHALSDDAVQVSEAEARFMLSACLAFAAWLKRSFPEE